MTISSTLAACLSAAFLWLAAVTGAAAAEFKPFEKQAFADAQKAGKPIVIEITATWCPTCAAQKPIINALATRPDYKDLTIFNVDFDSQKDAVRAFRANMQSTLIAYVGTKETARSVGDTKPASIETLFKSALAR